MTTRKKSSTTRKTKKQRIEEMEKADEVIREIILWFIVAISLFLLISNFGFGGVVGGFISDFLFGVFGLIAYVFPIVLLGGSFFAVSNKGNVFAVLKMVAVTLFVMFLCAFLSLVMYGTTVVTPVSAYLDSAKNHSGGGIIGGTIAYIFVPAFGIIGAYIIDIIVLIVSLVLITGKSAMNGMKKHGKKMYETTKESSERYKEQYQEYKEYKEQEKAAKRIDNKHSGVSLNTKIEKKAENINTDEMGEINIDNYPPMPEVLEETVTKLEADTSFEDKLMQEAINEPVQNDSKYLSEPVYEPEFTTEPEPFAGTEPFVEPVLFEEPVAFEEPEVIEKTVRKTRSSAEEIAQNVAAVEEEILSNTSDSETKEYEYFIPYDLLKDSPNKNSSGNSIQLSETKAKLETTLKNFGVNAKVVDSSVGPSVTRYEIELAAGVKVSKIVNLADDIKLNLAAADIRIEAPIPGKAAVGIEVPNSESTMVSFRELIECPDFERSPSNVTFAVGKDIGGKIKITDIAKMPHLLIAGSTGSGKSVCINTIIMSILYKAKPEDVKLIMVDPKVVELSVYNGIPHLMIPVVTDPKKASGALKWAVDEMADRYQRFADAGVREIKGYNAKVDTIEVPEGQERPKKMPQIVIIVDELADLMMVASKEIEEYICRLAQLARAAGIHLIIATQRPSVDVITGLIKANMPSRIAFAVTSGTDSRTILDMNGAEKLLGKGDMLFNPQGVPKPLRVQGAFISDDEVSKVVDYIKEHYGHAKYSSEMEQKIETMQASTNTTVSISDSDGSDDGVDPYFEQARDIIMDKQKASIGMLQRYLKVGFNRAARIMDQLEEAGVVGPEEGTKPRKVLITNSQEDYTE